MRLRSMRWSIFIGLMAVLVPAAEDAKACGHAIGEDVPRVDPRPAAVAAAEKAVGEGRYGPAAVLLRRVYPNIRTASPGARDALGNRALRTLAVATVRADGALFLMRRWKGSQEAHRRLNLEWAVASLRRLSETRKDDPGIQTELAEALSKIDRHRDEARALLTTLAGKDLIVSAHGYAALALLHSGAGDQKAYDEAVRRCQAMTKLANACPQAPTGDS